MVTNITFCVVLQEFFVRTLTALELCHHNNLAKIRFRQESMREHFQKCLDQKKLTQFPRELEEYENVEYKLYKFNRPQLKPF